MGKVLSVITRPIKNFNIESRAHKVISKDKPTLAPTFQANIKETERLLTDNPESFTNLLKKDLTLDTNLKDVYVKSYDPLIDKQLSSASRNDPNRPLPSNRHMVKHPEFGFNEPNIIPPGRCTLRQVLKILTNHQANPDAWDIAKEASSYNLSQETINNIVQYFRVYHVYIPDKDNKIVFAAPSIARKQSIDSGDKVQ